MDKTDYPYPATVPSFKTIKEARNALIDIQNSGLNFMWATMEKKYQGTITTTEILEQVRLEMRLAKWHRALDELEGRLAMQSGKLTAQAEQVEEDGIIILRLLHTVAYMWLSSCLSLKENAFDAFLSEFRQINTLSSKLLSRCRSSASTSYSPTPFPPTAGPCPDSGTFSIDTEIVGPLYFTALKCREPAICRQTLALLEQYNKRKGAVDSLLASKLATAIVQIEETSLLYASATPATPPNHDDLHQPQILPTRFDTTASLSRSHRSFSRSNNIMPSYHKPTCSAQPLGTITTFPEPSGANSVMDTHP